jgi:hypothetical protein
MDESRDSMIGRTELKIDNSGSILERVQRRLFGEREVMPMASGCSLEEELPFDKVIPPIYCSG